MPNYDVGEVFVLGDGERLRIVEIASEIVDELTELGIGSVFTVEPVQSTFPFKLVASVVAVLHLLIQHRSPLA